MGCPVGTWNLEEMEQLFRDKKGILVSVLPEAVTIPPNGGRPTALVVISDETGYCAEVGRKATVQQNAARTGYEVKVSIRGKVLTFRLFI